MPHLQCKRQFKSSSNLNMKKHKGNYILCLTYLLGFLLVCCMDVSAQKKTLNDSLHHVQMSLAAEVQKLMNDALYNEALIILEPEIKKHAIQDSVRELLEVLYIRTLKASGKSDSSVRAAKNWARREPYAIKPHLELYDIYYERGDYYNAAHQLELILMRKPGDVMLICQAAMLYMHSEELIKGEQLSNLGMERAEKAREKAAARSSRAMVFLKKKEYDKAIYIAKEAVAEDITYPESFYILGVAYARIGRQDLVCQPLRNAIELKGGPWCQDFYETKCMGR